MNVMELEGNALLTIPADQDPGSIDLDRSSTLDLLSQCQTDMQGAVIIYDNESQDEKVVKIVTKTECDTSMDGYVSPDDFENLITLHAPPGIKDEFVEEEYKPSDMGDCATNVYPTSDSTPNTPTTSAPTTSVSTTNVSPTNTSTNDISTKVEKPETTTNVSPAKDAQASINTSSELDLEGDTDDDETIATFVTSTGQQLALYAVEDSDEIYAVALYDESGEPPTNFHFLMKEDVERLIGEGAVKTVKRPTAQSRKDAPKSTGPKEEIKFERRQPQVGMSVPIKTEKEIKMEILETPEVHTIDEIQDMPIIEEPPPLCQTPTATVGSNAPLTSEPQKATTPAESLQPQSRQEASQKSTGQANKTTASPLLGVRKKPSANSQVGQAPKVPSSPAIVQSAKVPSSPLTQTKIGTTLQSGQAVSTTISTPPQMRQTTPQSRKTTPQSRQAANISITPQMRQTTPQSRQTPTVSTISQMRQTTPQAGQSAKVSTTPQMRQTTPQLRQASRTSTTPQVKQIVRTSVTPQSGQATIKTPQPGQTTTVSVTPRSGQPTKILTTPQLKQTPQVIPVQKTPQRIIYKHVSQAGPRSSQNLKVPMSQNQKSQAAPRIFQVQRPQGITTIAYVQKTQSAGFPLQQKPQTIIYQAQRVQGGKGAPQLQKPAGNKSALQMTKPQIIRGNSQASKTQIIRNVSQPYRLQTGEITQAYKTHLIKSGPYTPKAQVITEVPNRMMKFEVPKGQGSRQFQVHQPPKLQTMKNIIKTYSVNAKNPSLARASPANKQILPKTIKQEPGQFKGQTKSNHSYVITNDSESHTLDNTIEEIDSDVEIIEQSTVQYILCDSIPSDSELTFDELQKSLQSFKMNKSETAKDKENSNLIRPGKTKETIITFSKVSKPPIQITSQKKQLTPALQTEQQSPKKPRSTSNMLHRKIKKEVIDPEYGDIEEEHVSSDDMSRSRLDSSAAENSMNASKVKRSRKQQFTAFERTDSEIIIQPASAFSEDDGEASTSKKRGRKKKKLSPDPDYNPRQGNKKTKKLLKSVEVIDLDEDEGEKEKSGKSKGSSDKENDVISVEDSDGDHETSQKKLPQKKTMTLMQCCHCMKNFKKRLLLERHLQACPDSPIYVQKDVEKNAAAKSGKQYPCKHCGEIFHTVVDIARHARMNHRKKGRPSQSKSTENKSASSEEETSAVENSTGHNLRRGRRPTKRNLSPDNSVTRSKEQKVNSSDEAPTKTRRRGRPPKKGLKKDSTPEVRKRGRPSKKSIAQVDEKEEKKDNEDHDEEGNDEKEDVQEKDLNSEEKEKSVEQESKTTDDQNDEANKEEKSKEGDGADNDNSVQPEQSKEESAIPKTPTQPPKKRGRPSKRKSSLEEEKESNAADQKDEGSSSDNPAEPRKRGRPSRKSSVNDDAVTSSAAADDVEKNLESMFKDT